MGLNDMSGNNTIMFISHGGGPMPLLEDKNHTQMIDTLKRMKNKIAKPSAILVISAHWETQVATITSGAAPPLIYDYNGFPKETYQIKYPSPGQPELANKIYESLIQAGIEAEQNDQRGYDHGMFVPLTLMYPDADIPCVQLSLVNSLDSITHLAIGEALQALEWDNLLVIGSGFSFHNMRAFFDSSADENNLKNKGFEQWLISVMSDKNLSEQQRTQHLAQWNRAPHARFCHPREEHLLPLHVCYGMAGRASDEIFEVTVMNKQASMYLWQGEF
jgi:4,5-DOPA dioxygenase extradiol|tara:strand:- start:1590 stop:2414 length:825 start_codon:yes stop_codon:yes gene_type:complete